MISILTYDAVFSTSGLLKSLRALVNKDCCSTQVCWSFGDSEEFWFVLLISVTSCLITSLQHGEVDIFTPQ